MPIRSRDLALETLVLMTSATLLIMGLGSLLARLLDETPLLLVADAALASLLAGGGLLATLHGWSWLRRLAGALLGLLMGYTLLHNGLSPIGVRGDSLLTGEPRIGSLPAIALLVVALCLTLGLGGAHRKRLWAGVGCLLSSIVAVVALLLLLPTPGRSLDGLFSSSPLSGVLLIFLLGLAMLAAGLRSGPRLPLGRLSLATALAGIALSSLAWLMLSLQQQSSLQQQAEYLLDNLQLNAEQTMQAKLSLMQRMADRLDAAETRLDPEVLARDATSYLRDVPSLRLIGLTDDRLAWEWRRARSGPDQAWLEARLAEPTAQLWLQVAYPHPRMLQPDPDAAHLALLAIPVLRHEQLLLTLLDLSQLLDNELRVQLGPFQARALRQGQPLLELRQPGHPRESWTAAPRLAQRQVGLPGGLNLTLEAYPSTPTDWRAAGLMPVAVAGGGLILSWLLAFSLGQVRLVMGRSRQLSRARLQLEDQQGIQGMIVREAPLEETLEAACEALERQLAGEAYCSIMHYQDSTQRLSLVAGGRLPAEYREVMQDIVIGPNVGACGSAAFLGEEVVCRDLSRDGRWQGYHALLERHGLAACWSSPLHGSDGKLLGTFAVYRHRPGEPSEPERVLIRQASELVALAIERHESGRVLRTLERSVESSINGVVIADALAPDLPIIYANPAFCRVTGYPLEEVLGRNCRFLQGKETDPEMVRRLRRRIDQHRETHVTLCNYRRDGSPFWNDLYISPVRDGEGQVTHFVGVLHDISEQKAYEAQLAHHASHDALTGLPNRTLLEDHLLHDYALAYRQQTLLAVLFIDLDDFKPINDSLGHALGDQVLIEVARRIEGCVREGDTVARLGGDEFVVLLPGLRHEEQAMQIAERLLSLLARPYRQAGHDLLLSASIGITIGQPEMHHPQELIQQADMAMYKAKQQGRNNYQWFTQEITEKVRQRVEMRTELQDAIDQDQLELHYQPLLDRQGELVGVEALLRWHHPTRGQVSPGVFIPLAESTGQIIAISRWVLERACLDMHTLEKRGLGQLRVAVNLSPLQFHRTNFLASLRQTLAHTGLPASRLELELTEGILMDDTESAIDILHALRGMGIGVSIDDFGTGYSSLSYLKHLPISKVKIDCSFIKEVTSSANDAAIVQGIISMAHHLGLGVVAEGIETREQWQCLADFGCDSFQGFLLARPMPREALEAFIRQQQAVAGPKEE